MLVLSLVLLAALPRDLAAQEQPYRVLSGFVLQSEFGPPSCVIQTPEELAEFVACLPERLPHMKEPAPPNPDPIRQPDFHLDFAKQVLVVCVQRDTISAFPRYKRVGAESEARVVDFDVPGRPPEARPYDWGVYTAVVLPRVGLPTRIREAAVKSDW